MKGVHKAMPDSNLAQKPGGVRLKGTAQQNNQRFISRI
jgi:hypothetical protein